MTTSTPLWTVACSSRVTATTVRVILLELTVGYAKLAKRVVKRLEKLSVGINGDEMQAHGNPRVYTYIE